MDWSPTTNWPAELIYSPNWYQKGVYQIWCNPNGINALSISPKINAESVSFALNILLENSNRRFWIGGQITAIIAPNITPAIAATIGTNLLPEKKPKNSGNFIS